MFIEMTGEEIVLCVLLTTFTPVVVGGEQRVILEVCLDSTKHHGSGGEECAALFQGHG